MSQKPFLVTMPHSGERVPDQTPWLKNLPEPILMADVDRFVDRLYRPTLEKLKIPWVQTEWHRYAADLNRIPEDIDATSVKGNNNPPGMHSRGFHWTVTTLNYPLMTSPMSLSTHQELVNLIYKPFHEQVQKQIAVLKSQGHKTIFHLDLHSMPSLGTKMHKDPGERRADIVISDSLGKSCREEFLDLVISSYVRAGFRVIYNWPYVGGRLTEQYGKPDQGQQTIQVELNRALYMNEETKQINEVESLRVQKKLEKALSRIFEKLPVQS